MLPSQILGEGIREGRRQPPGLEKTATIQKK